MSRRPSDRWAVRLADRADQDFVEILRWTAESFGVRQARVYARTLSLAIAALIEGPSIVGARRSDEIGPGIGTLHVRRLGRKGRHFVVFRVTDERTIDVLRLLHDSMDLAQHIDASQEDGTRLPRAKCRPSLGRRPLDLPGHAAARLHPTLHDGRTTAAMPSRPPTAVL